LFLQKTLHETFEEKPQVEIIKFQKL